MFVVAFGEFGMYKDDERRRAKNIKDQGGLWGCGNQD